MKLIQATFSADIGSNILFFIAGDGLWSAITANGLLFVIAGYSYFSIVAGGSFLFQVKNPYWHF